MQHYQTSTDYLCLPACVKMILGDTHSIDEIAKLLDFKVGMGVNKWDLVNLKEWGYDVKLGMGSLGRLRQCLEDGIYPIMFVALLGKNNESHSVILTGLNGETATISDPVQPGPLDLPLATLTECWEKLGRFTAIITDGEMSTGRGGGGLPDTGFVYNNDGNPLEVYSLAPARQTNFGKIVKVSGILLSGNSIAAAQAESNTLAGLFLAWQNIRFPNISFTTRLCNRVLEPATLDYFGVVLDDIRGHDWDGKEFLCTSVDMSFDHEKGIIETTISGEASTWGPDGVAGPYPDAPPVNNPPADNPPEYWPDWPPGATPDNPDGDPPPWAEPDPDLPEVAYLVTGDGFLIRVTNPSADDPDDVVYEAFQVDGGGGQLYFIALDEFDKRNTAMVCGQNGLWRTYNLADSPPTWAIMATTPVGYQRFSCVRSSPVRDRCWMAIATDVGDFTRVFWTINDGTSWNDKELTQGVCGVNAPRAARGSYLEMSSHDYRKAWINTYNSDTAAYLVVRTDDLWDTAACETETTCDFLDTNTAGLGTVPPSHHRFLGNDNDQIAIFGGTDYSDNGNHAPKILYCEGDIATPTSCTTFCSTGNASPTWYSVQELGCFKYSENLWWALVWCFNSPRFYTSTNGTAWDLRANLTAASYPIKAFDSVLNRNKFYITCWSSDAARAPLWVSLNSGVNWQVQDGNWAAVCAEQGWGGFVQAYHGALVEP